MSTTQRVDFGGVHVRGAWNSPSEDVSADVSFYTPTGQARLASLSEDELLQLSIDALEAVRKLRTNLARRAEAGPVRVVVRQR
jgi:hypothetical protein